MSDDKTTGQLAVVTGASSGIGFELAKQFAMHGFDLLVAAEDAGIVEAAQAFEQYGTRVSFLQVDLAKEEGVQELYQRIQSTGQEIECIAINAGVGVGGTTFDKTDLQKELNLLRLNVVSTVHLTKLILQDMLANGHGRILLTSSVAAIMPAPYEAVYAASKAFIQSFSESIRAEVKDRGVVVTALQPGPTETNFFHRADMDDTKVGHAKKDDPAVVARQGYDALMSGSDAIIAGSVKNKVQANVARFMPQKIAAKMHESMAKPDSTSDQKN